MRYSGAYNAGASSFNGHRLSDKPKKLSTKLCVRFTEDQILWLHSKTRPFYTLSDVLRDLVEFTMGPKEDLVDAIREELGTDA